MIKWKSSSRAWLTGLGRSELYEDKERICFFLFCHISPTTDYNFLIRHSPTEQSEHAQRVERRAKLRV